MPTYTPERAIADEVVTLIEAYRDATPNGFDPSVGVYRSWRSVDKPGRTHIIVDVRRVESPPTMAPTSHRSTVASPSAGASDETYTIGEYVAAVTVTIYATDRDARDLLAPALRACFTPDPTGGRAVALTLTDYNGETVLLDFDGTTDTDAREAAVLGDWRHALRFRTRGGRELATKSWPRIVTADAVGAGSDTDPTIGTDARPTSS